MIVLITDRLILRKINNIEEEKQSLFLQIGEWDVIKWFSQIPYPYTYDALEKWLDVSKQNEFELNIFLDNLLIGGVWITLFEGLTQSENNE